MLRRRAAALALPALLLTAGCLGALDPVLAPLPPEGTVFTSAVWRCSWKPHTHLLAVYPNATLYHAVYTEAFGLNGSRAPPENVRLHPGEVAQVAVDAAAAANTTVAWSGREGNFTHGERVNLSANDLLTVRAHVAAADIANLSGPYRETTVVDGCTFHHGAWQGGAHHAVESHGDEEPFGLKALREALFAIHDPWG